MAMDRKKNVKTRFRWLVRWTAAIIAVLLTVTAAAAFFYVKRVEASLPPLPDLNELRPAYGTRVQSQEDVFFGGEAAVEPVSYSELPPLLIMSFLAAEDEDFFQHRGYNLRSIFRAFFDNYRAGRTVQGASTITQQVAKHFLGDERTVERKLQELLLARRIEAHYSKEEILAAYLGGIYFGEQAWGVTQASHRYFSVPPEELTLSQMATLAGLLPAPSVFNPVNNPTLARRERNRVLRRLHEVGVLTKEEKLRLREAPLEGPVTHQAQVSVSPEAVGTVLRQWETIGRGRDWESSNLEVVTTHHPGLQTRARQALEAGLEAHDRRGGYRGAAGRVTDIDAFDQALDELTTTHYTLARVVSVSSEGLLLRVPGGEHLIPPSDLDWLNGEHPRTNRPRRNRPWQAYFQEKDVVFLRTYNDTKHLWQWPVFEGAVLAVDHHSGETLASVGAFDVDRSRFHRGEQACRQPGSTFKTVTFAEAFTRGVTPATLLSDVPTDVDSRSGVWQPRNADHDFRGYITALNAYALSRNIPAVNLFQYLGTQSVIERARRMGIESMLDPTPSLALGASCVRVPEILAVHAAIARDGRAFERRHVAYVRDLSTGQLRDQGHFLQRHPAALPRLVRAAALPETPERVVTKPVNYLLHRALRAVVTNGTGHAVPNEWPVSGKTGTSNDFDAWFVAFDPTMTTAVWVGSDQNDRTFESGEHGGSVALPIFVGFYRGLAPLEVTWPPAPQDEIEYVRIDTATGLRARAGEPGQEYPFLRGTAPRVYAPTSASRQLERFDALSY